MGYSAWLYVFGHFVLREKHSNNASFYFDVFFEKYSVNNIK